MPGKSAFSGLFYASLNFADFSCFYLFFGVKSGVKILSKNEVAHAANLRLLCGLILFGERKRFRLLQKSTKAPPWNRSSPSERLGGKQIELARFFSVIRVILSSSFRGIKAAHLFHGQLDKIPAPFNERGNFPGELCRQRIDLTKSIPGVILTVKNSRCLRAGLDVCELRSMWRVCTMYELSFGMYAILQKKQTCASSAFSIGASDLTERAKIGS